MLHPTVILPTILLMTSVSWAVGANAPGFDPKKPCAKPIECALPGTPAGNTPPDLLGNSAIYYRVVDGKGMNFESRYSMFDTKNPMPKDSGEEFYYYKQENCWIQWEKDTKGLWTEKKGQPPVGAFGTITPRIGEKCTAKPKG